MKINTKQYRSITWLPKFNKMISLPLFLMAAIFLCGIFMPSGLTKAVAMIVLMIAYVAAAKRLTVFYIRWKSQRPGSTSAAS